MLAGLVSKKQHNERATNHKTVSKE